MSQYVFKMPDLGEARWMRKSSPGMQAGRCGDEDQLMVEVMTDKRPWKSPRL